ncbi:hypothetical protein WAF17_19250 [Bernardetia sp. ABR2-2B]|uniref:hypothetical protein n=1 Tax=Bernardetia sp. ABR2-2B TaxID=3127472 RepID=UPI0030D135E5
MNYLTMEEIDKLLSDDRFSSLVENQLRDTEKQINSEQNSKNEKNKTEEKPREITVRFIKK